MSHTPTSQIPQLPSTGTRPFIGVTCDMERFTDRRGMPQERLHSPRAYSEAILHAGGLPILLPVTSEAHAAAYLPILHGLVVTGGDFDVPPDYYGEAARPVLGATLPQRSACERALVLASLERRLPLLGVCGGMQLLNVVCGGSLYQDLAERPNTDVHVQPHDRAKPLHRVDLTPGTTLASVYGGVDAINVNSTHHQMVKRLGASLRAVGTAQDGVVEAVEHTDAKAGFCVGVQWHPEAMPAEHQAPYRALVAAAGEFRLRQFG